MGSGCGAENKAWRKSEAQLRRDACSNSTRRRTNSLEKAQKASPRVRMDCKARRMAVNTAAAASQLSEKHALDKADNSAALLALPTSSPDPVSGAVSLSASAHPSPKAKNCCQDGGRVGASSAANSFAGTTNARNRAGAGSTPALWPLCMLSAPGSRQGSSV